MDLLLPIIAVQNIIDATQMLAFFNSLLKSPTIEKLLFLYENENSDLTTLLLTQNFSTYHQRSTINYDSLKDLTIKEWQPHKRDDFNENTLIIVFFNDNALNKFFNTFNTLGAKSNINLLLVTNKFLTDTKIQKIFNKLHNDENAFYKSALVIIHQCGEISTYSMKLFQQNVYKLNIGKQTFFKELFPELEINFNGKEFPIFASFQPPYFQYVRNHNGEVGVGGSYITLATLIAKYFNASVLFCSVEISSYVPSMAEFEGIMDFYKNVMERINHFEETLPITLENR